MNELLACLLSYTKGIAQSIQTNTLCCVGFTSIQKHIHIARLLSLDTGLCDPHVCWWKSIRRKISWARNENGKLYIHWLLLCCSVRLYVLHYYIDGASDGEKLYIRALSSRRSVTFVIVPLNVMQTVPRSWAKRMEWISRLLTTTTGTYQVSERKNFSFYLNLIVSVEIVNGDFVRLA